MPLSSQQESPNTSYSIEENVNGYEMKCSFDEQLGVYRLSFPQISGEYAFQNSINPWILLDESAETAKYVVSFAKDYMQHPAGDYPQSRLNEIFQAVKALDLEEVPKKLKREKEFAPFKEFNEINPSKNKISVNGIEFDFVSDGLMGKSPTFQITVYNAHPEAETDAVTPYRKNEAIYIGTNFETAQKLSSLAVKLANEGKSANEISNALKETLHSEPYDNPIYLVDQTNQEIRGVIQL